MKTEDFIVHMDERQNRIYLKTSFSRQHGGLILVFGFALVLALLTPVAKNILANLEYQNVVFQLLSFLLASVFFLVYLLISRPKITWRRWPWLLIIILSLLLGFVFLTYGGTTWIWFSPLFLFYRITHAIGAAASVLVSVPINFCSFIICSFFYYLISSRLLTAGSVKKGFRNDIRFMLVISLLFSIVLLLTAWCSHGLSLTGSVLIVYSVFFESSLFALLFHIIYARIANSARRALAESETQK